MQVIRRKGVTGFIPWNSDLRRNFVIDAGSYKVEFITKSSWCQVQATVRPQGSTALKGLTITFWYTPAST
jgi:hypothetical protein